MNHPAMGILQFGGFILRDVMLRMAPQDEVLNPHGEERSNAARLEPRGHVIRAHDPSQAEWTLDYRQVTRSAAM